MNGRSQTQPHPLPCVHGVGSDQLSQLTSQRNFLWIENQNLGLQVGAIRTQAESLQQENARLHQSYVIEFQQHQRTMKELSDLRDLVHRLDKLFPSGDEDEIPSVVQAFFELEARDAALRQAETEICKEAKGLRMFGQRIEERYAHGRRDPIRTSNQMEVLPQPLRYPPQYPPQTAGEE